MNALLTPTVRQISAQVDAVLRHDPEAIVIGIRAQKQDSWPSSISVRERSFRLCWCPSPIAVRAELVSSEALGSDAGLVLLTPLDDHALGDDVLARLSRGKVFPVESWDMLRYAFQAREIDSRLARWPWVAEALLDHMPLGGYPPVVGGFLDADTAWGHLLRSVLGLVAESGHRPDLAAILRWTLSPEGTRIYGALPDGARRQLGEWFVELHGACGRLVAQVLDAGFGGELMPLALLCGVIFPEGDEGSLPREVVAAAVRLERFTGGAPVARADGIRLYRAASQLCAAFDAAVLMPILDVADRLLESLHLESQAYRSNDLPAGFHARLESFAEAIAVFLTKSDPESVAAVSAAGTAALSHRLAATQTARMHRVVMAMRLVRWLGTAELREDAGIGSLASNYAEDGAFVDWARLALLGGDELASLTRAYGALRESVRIRRERLNHRFGRAMAAWNNSGCPPVDGLIPVERLVTEVVAPVAAENAVLLLVVDGLSLPICHELMEDAARHGWMELTRQGARRAACGVATVPSVTEVSRTSLFCGQLVQGQAANEKTGFAQHPALIALSASNRPSARPVVFHKADLTSGGDGVTLSEVVRDAIGSRERKVVAVVFNGVDDHLSGSDQLHPRWTLDDLRLIKPLLYEARLANRIVVMTADHGHVIDESSHVLGAISATGNGGGDRWRPVGAVPITDEELLLQEGRVLAADGIRQVVVPWTETLRYGSKKNGYHGGISVQEMLVPVTILSSGNTVPNGLQPAAPVVPSWWEETVPAVAAPAPAAAQPETKPTRRPAKTPADERQTTLFAGTAEQVVEAAPAAQDWITELLSSPAYAAQKQWAARAALKDNEIRALLEALGERGGRISKTALATKLGMPLMRVSGFVNSARRVLNVDQAAILVLDELEGSVSLNHALLLAQFCEGTK